MTIQKNYKKLKLRLVTSYELRPGNKMGLFLKKQISKEVNK